MTMLVREERAQSGGRGRRESVRGRTEMHSHLSSNYTTTLIPLGLELIARVRPHAAVVIAVQPGPLPAPA